MKVRKQICAACSTLLSECARCGHYKATLTLVRTSAGPDELWCTTCRDADCWPTPPWRQRRQENTR